MFQDSSQRNRHFTNDEQKWYHAPNTHELDVENTSGMRGKWDAGGRR